MAKINALKIAYAIVPTNAQYDKRYYKDYSFRVRLPNYNSENNSLLDIYKETTEFENIIEIENIDSGVYKINGKPYLVENIKQTIKEKIKWNPNYVVRFNINDNIDFSAYFNIISKTKEAVNELRNEYALTNYSTEFENLEVEQMDRTIEKYELRIFEITNDMKKQLEN
jgi:biopolymer transport protein ExbD